MKVKELINILMKAPPESELKLAMSLKTYTLSGISYNFNTFSEEPTIIYIKEVKE